MKLLILFVPLLFLIATTLVTVNKNSYQQLQSAATISEPDPTETPTPTPTPTPIPQLRIKASIPYWDQNSAYASVQKYPGAFDEVSVFWYLLNTAGTQIFPYKYVKEDTNMVEFFQDQSIDVSAVITNLPEEEGSSWDSIRVKNAIETSEKRAIIVDEFEKISDRFDFSGIIVDFEGVDGSLKDQFSEFIELLSQRLHEKGKIVGVALHPKKDSHDEERYAFQDWERLSRSADALYIMTYGEHWDGGEPGPIASLRWVEEVIQFANELQVPQEKIHLGIPLYGYDWQHDSSEEATALTHADAQKLLQNYEATPTYVDEVPTFSYVDRSTGQTHEVWFEDARSVNARIALAKRYGLGGVSFWRLGGEDSTIWDTIIYSNPDN